jgi:malate dehydrogenase (oxaloacetate-decarboxylating)
MDLLNRPGLNKGAAFTEEERSEHGLHGLLRSWSDTSIGALQDTNEILFYRLLVDHIESSPVSTASL